MSIQRIVIKAVFVLLAGIVLIISIRFIENVYRRFRAKRSWKKADPEIPIQFWYIGGILERGIVFGRVLLSETTVGAYRGKNPNFSLRVPKECSPENPLIIINRVGGVAGFSWSGCRDVLSQIPVLTFEEFEERLREYQDHLQEIIRISEGISSRLTGIREQIS